MNVIQDVIPRKERTVRQIPTRNGKIPEKIGRPKTGFPPDGGAGGKMNVWFKFSLFAAIVLLLSLFAAFSTVWSSGKLIITPRQQQTVLDAEITARKDADGGLPFQIMTMEKTGQKEVEPSGEKQVSERASGAIVVYNDYSEDPQRLIKNTRFETESGLVYRIRESITVPGRHVEGRQTVPGSLETKIFADTAGEKYNIGLSDFTIPGFKGDPRYDKFYARSKTSMSGGFEGMKKVVDENVLNSARKSIIEELRASLYKEAAGAVPEGFILYNDAIFMGPAEETEEGKGVSVMLSEKIKLYGVLLPKKELSGQIAEKTMADWAKREVLISNLEDLDFTVVGKTGIKPESVLEIPFRIVGNPIIVLQFDEEVLKKEMAGKNRKGIMEILAKYDSVERAEIKMTPFWKISFPRDVSKIKIVKNIKTAAD